VILVGDLTVLEALAGDVIDSGSPLSVSALHGAVCGLAVFGAPYFPFYELADLLDPGLDGDHPALVRFVEVACEALGSEDLEFAPLLPDDDAPQEERLEAVGLWCASFLQAFGSGLAMAPEVEGLAGSGFTLPDEVQEIIDDLAAIAEVEPDSVEDFEGDESDIETQLVELQEFVKVGVLLIKSVLSRGPADQDE